MSNKFNNINSSNLLDNKLDILISDFNTSIREDKVSEQEDILSRFNELVSIFKRTLENPLFDDTFKVKPGDQVNLDSFNNVFKTVLNDIKILYKELSSLHNEIVRNFNNITSNGDRIKAKIKSIRSKIATYKLYTNSSDLQFIKDSFDNFSLIEQDSTKYNSIRNNVNLNEGTVTLPIRTKDVKDIKISSIQIGSISNGTLGNNQELNQLQRASLDSMIDNNPDTWFEYEIVKRDSFGTPLILELRIVFEEESIINNIEIQSTSFAVRNFPKIIQLDSSIDGNFFVDIIQDIPLDIGEDNLLLLSPIAGKFSGINSFSFKPRKAKYLRLKIQQDDHYLIQTPVGFQLRKAIGLKNLNIKSIPYESNGEIVSVLHSINDEIKTVGLELSSNNFGVLTNIDSEVSVDENSWLSISPTSSINEDEVLKFNTIDDNSFNTDFAISKIRYRAQLSRNTNEFNNFNEVIKKQTTNTELLSINPSTSSIQLIQSPISGTVSVFSVAFGQVGGDSLIIQSSDIIDLDGNLYIHLPIAFRNRTVPLDSFVMIVNGEPWERVTTLSGANAGDKFYEFDIINNTIKTGNDTQGKKPSGTIVLRFLREQILFSQDEPRIAKLNFSSDSVKDSVKLLKLLPEETITDFTLQKDARVLRLGRTDIISISIVLDDTGIFTSEQQFINGVFENTSTGDFSIDYINGVIYTYDLTPSDDDVIIDFVYNPKVLLNDFTISGDEITLVNNDYSAEEFQETIVLTNRSVINLNKIFIELKSLQFLTLISSFQREVPFVGDGSEFRLDLSSSELAGLFTVDYKKGKIYTNSPVTGSLSIRYRYTNLYAEYNIANMLAPSDFTIKDNSLLFSESFVISEFGNSLGINNARNLFKVQYDFIEETQDDLKELEQYYTPFLRGYTLKILPRSKF